MNLGRFSLVFAAIAFYWYGAAFLFFPHLMTALLGIKLSIPSAVIDIRATYGGSVLGAAIFFTWCALKDEWLSSGLTAQAAILGGFMAGRVLGIVTDSEPNSFIYILLVGEILGFALAVVALRNYVQGKSAIENSAL